MRGEESTPACERCGNFAALSLVWGRSICEACRGLRHPAEREPLSVLGLIRGSVKLAGALGLRAWALVFAAMAVTRASSVLAEFAQADGQIATVLSRLVYMIGMLAITGTATSIVTITAATMMIRVEPPDPRAATLRVLRRWPALVGMLLLILIANGVASFCVVLVGTTLEDVSDWETYAMLRRYAVRVPSVYVAGISAIAAPILVLESTGVARALGGSVRRLFRSSGLIFVVVLLLTAPLHASHYALDSAVQWLPEPGFDRMLRSSFRPVREVVTILLSSVSQLLSATLSALLYVKRPPRSESWS